MKKIITICLMTLLMTGCNDLAVKIRAKIVSDKDLNPNIRRRSAPVELRIYHLRDEKNFNRARYFELLRNDKKTLGSDLIRKESMVIRPGQTIPYRTDADQNTKYLAVFAAYRLRIGYRWKAIKRTSAFKFEYVTITLKRNSVSIENK